MHPPIEDHQLLVQGVLATLREHMEEYGPMGPIRYRDGVPPYMVSLDQHGKLQVTHEDVQIEEGSAEMADFVYLRSGELYQAMRASQRNHRSLVEDMQRLAGEIGPPTVLIQTEQGIVSCEV